MGSALCANTVPSAVALSGRVASVGHVNPTDSTHIEMNDGASAAGLDDHIYQRLLKERIVFLGSEVRDQNANAICAHVYRDSISVALRASSKPF